MAATRDQESCMALHAVAMTAPSALSIKLQGRHKKERREKEQVRVCVSCSANNNVLRGPCPGLPCSMWGAFHQGARTLPVAIAFGP